MGTFCPLHSREWDQALLHDQMWFMWPGVRALTGRRWDFKELGDEVGSQGCAGPELVKGWDRCRWGLGFDRYGARRGAGERRTGSSTADHSTPPLLHLSRSSLCPHPGTRGTWGVGSGILSEALGVFSCLFSFFVLFWLSQLCDRAPATGWPGAKRRKPEVSTEAAAGWAGGHNPEFQGLCGEEGSHVAAGQGLFVRG